MLAGPQRSTVSPLSRNHVRTIATAANARCCGNQPGLIAVTTRLEERWVTGP